MKFEKSEAIEYLYYFVSQNSIKVEQGNGGFPINQKRVNVVVKKLCHMWNKDLKSRNFLITLIRSFLPLDKKKKVVEFSESDIPRDCILNSVELVDMNEFISTITKFETLKDDMQRQTNTQRKLQKRDTLGDWKDAFPTKIKHADFAYYSDDFDKFICRETAYAIKWFVQSGFLLKDLDFSKLVENINKKISLKRTSTKPMSSVINNVDREKLQNLLAMHRANAIKNANKLYAQKKFK